MHVLSVVPKIVVISASVIGSNTHIESVKQHLSIYCQIDGDVALQTRKHFRTDH